MADIRGFFGPFRWLSNFHYCPVQLDGTTYPTNEHAYQAAKHLDMGFREVLKRYTYPRDAMNAGRSRPARSDWETIKIAVMLDLNRQKFAQEPLRTWLLETGDGYLEETNTWGDHFWGVCRGIGENNLGKILMQVRSELRNGDVAEQV